MPDFVQQDMQPRRFYKIRTPNLMIVAAPSATHVHHGPDMLLKTAECTDLGCLVAKAHCLVRQRHRELFIWSTTVHSDVDALLSAATREHALPNSP